METIFSKKLLSLLIIVVIIITGIYMLSIFKKSDSSLSYKILETRDFSCPGMTGFTFKYPVFEGWEMKDIFKPKEIDSSDGFFYQSCFINLKWPNTSVFPNIGPSIQVTKIFPAPKPIEEEMASVAIHTNNNAINYRFLYDPNIKTKADRNFIEFYLDDFAIKIEPVFIEEQLGKGFSKDQFFKTVIESFRVGK